MNASMQDTPISSIVSEIHSAAKAIHDGEEEIKAARKRALFAARNLVATLEDPTETLFQHAFGGPDRVCVRLAVQLGLFHAVAGKEGRPIGAAELAEISGAEQLLIVRIMRVLVAFRFVGEAGPENYIATSLTKTMTIPPIEAAVRFLFDHASQVLPKIPAFFEKNGYKTPTDPLDGPFQFAMNTKLGFFEYLEQDPKVIKDFDTSMTISRSGGRPVFAEWFPVQERILDGYRSEINQADESHSDDVLIVDVGGGRGQDLEMFKKKFPQAPGRMILQDLPRTVAGVKLSAGMEVMAYDFFTPQPVKGARTYFMHYILHNWPDHLATTILRNTASAMKPGYSKLILNEYILPATGCPVPPSWFDWHMMAAHASCERTEKQFHDLVVSAGLKVTKFLYPEGSFDGVVEVILNDEGAVENKGVDKVKSNGVDEVKSNGCGEAAVINGQPLPLAPS